MRLSTQVKLLEASELKEGGAATPRPPLGSLQPPQLFSAWGASDGMCTSPAALPKVYEADSSLSWLPVCNTHLCACACMCVQGCVCCLWGNQPRIRISSWGEELGQKGHSGSPRTLSSLYCLS